MMVACQRVRVCIPSDKIKPWAVDPGKFGLNKGPNGGNEPLILTKQPSREPPVLVRSVQSTALKSYKGKGACG
jgi:hypothetical protein